MTGQKPVFRSKCESSNDGCHCEFEMTAFTLCALAPLREVFRNPHLRLLRSVRLFFSDAVDGSNHFA